MGGIDRRKRLVDASDDTLGGRLSAARDAAGVSVGDLANRVGVKRESLLAWEADRSEPRPTRLLEVAGILGVSPMWLMTGYGQGPYVENDTFPLEAMRVQLKRLTDSHMETGRLIKQLAQQLDRYEKDFVQSLEQNGEASDSPLVREL
ncbi:helix-turn-helix transcriptional regulator [Peteryoungia desertarenae]|uniref:Helix-turn-helix transcriptional regulator n=1 Tax=Peteryoungia desertarenae TaxID=1813451 RepID=A0ABX6QQI5_9HYPH|nr:helix-turn-helix transcriptional regulator [Peteryoungia desertarenae]QLF70561.1 helix-turn-helix transcriptional regulator [Peteryoungia desertarenae]